MSDHEPKDDAYGVIEETLKAMTTLYLRIGTGTISEDEVRATLREALYCIRDATGCIRAGHPERCTRQHISEALDKLPEIDAFYDEVEPELLADPDLRHAFDALCDARIGQAGRQEVPLRQCLEECWREAKASKAKPNYLH